MVPTPAAAIRNLQGAPEFALRENGTMWKKTEERAEPPDPYTEGGGAFWRFVLPLSLLLIGASIGFALTALAISYRLS